MRRGDIIYNASLWSWWLITVVAHTPQRSSQLWFFSINTGFCKASLCGTILSSSAFQSGNCVQQSDFQDGGARSTIENSFFVVVEFVYKSEKKSKTRHSGRLWNRENYRERKLCCCQISYPCHYSYKGKRWPLKYSHVSQWTSLSCFIHDDVIQSRTVMMIGMDGPFRQCPQTGQRCGLKKKAALAIQSKSNINLKSCLFRTRISTRIINNKFQESILAKTRASPVELDARIQVYLFVCLFVCLFV